MFVLAISLLLLPVVASAEDFCTPMGAIHERVFFCEDDNVYAEHAQQCAQRFRELVNAKNIELRKILAADIARAKGDAQNIDFKTTQVSYESTDATLRETIRIGQHARAEVVAYGDDFVAPFSYPWMDLGPFPGLHHPVVQELFRSADCYKENIEIVEQVTADFDLMLKQLEQTREKTAQLHKASNNREGKLDDLMSLTAQVAGGKNAPAVPSGRSKNSASDVTGIRESRAKDKKLDLVKGLNAVTKPGPSSISSRRLASEVSASFGQKSLQFEERDRRAAELDANPPPGAKTPPSVGAALWGDAEKPAQAKLLIEAEPLNKNEFRGNVSASQKSASPNGGVQSAGELIGAGRGMAGSDTGESPERDFQPRNEIGGVAPPVAREVSQAAKEALLASDTDLFAAVSSRYRASELFRRARVTTVPLGEFAPSLKR